MRAEHKIHPDARKHIADALAKWGKRTMNKALKSDYVQSGLDRFEWLWPHLVIGQEVVFQRQEILDHSGPDRTGERWSEHAASKFLKRLAAVGVLYVKNRGKAGLGLTLRVDLRHSPWKKRRPQGTRVAPTFTAPEPKVEMPTAYFAPLAQEETATEELDDEVQYLDTDLALDALGATAATLRQIRDALESATDLRAALALKGYETREMVHRALQQLALIRSAWSSGENSELTEAIELERRSDG